MFFGSEKISCGSWLIYFIEVTTRNLNANTVKSGPDVVGLFFRKHEAAAGCPSAGLAQPRVVLLTGAAEGYPHASALRGLLLVLLSSLRDSLSPLGRAAAHVSERDLSTNHITARQVLWSRWPGRIAVCDRVVALQTPPLDAKSSRRGVQLSFYFFRGRPLPRVAGGVRSLGLVAISRSLRGLPLLRMGFTGGGASTADR